mgnify:CR=1 FL=1
MAYTNLLYHIVFRPKNSEYVITIAYEDVLYRYIWGYVTNKKGTLLRIGGMPDHIHMLVSIPPKYSVSQIMGYLKGKSSLMIFEKYANMKYKYGNRHFWCRGYYVDTVGRNKKVIEQYIRNQLQEDVSAEQLSLKEYIDPFTGKPAEEGK